MEISLQPVTNIFPPTSIIYIAYMMPEIMRKNKIMWNNKIRNISAYVKASVAVGIYDKLVIALLLLIYTEEQGALCTSF